MWITNKSLSGTFVLKKNDEYVSSVGVVGTKLLKNMT